MIHRSCVHKIISSNDFHGLLQAPEGEGRKGIDDKGEAPLPANRVGNTGRRWLGKETVN